MIIDAGLTQPEDQETDVCIIGSGPGGSASARTLARHGYRVIVLEWGGAHTTASFKNDGIQATNTLYADHGKKAVEGVHPFLILQGKGLGGATLVNSGISFRAPQKALEHWTQIAGLKQTTRSTLDPYMIEVEKTLEVNVMDIHKMGRNNLLLHEGLKKLGWSGAVIPRNAVGCAPCARCFFGCPVGAKRSTDKNFLMQAQEKGAQIFINAQADSFHVDEGKLRKLKVKTFKDDVYTGNFTVRAKHFILAAGTVGSAKILLKNKLANSSDQVGRNFRCHPSTGVLGEFADEVNGHKSITQGYYCDEFFGEDILLETFWAPAEGIAMVLPGIGIDLIEKMKNYKHFAGTGGMIKEEGAGRVSIDRDGFVQVKHGLTTTDEKRLTKTLYKCAEALLAAGAKTIYSQHPYAPAIKSMAQLRELENKYPNVGQGIILEGNHAQGSCRMNNDSSLGVVNEFGKSHDIENLWVMDSSIFPDALGVNPQITIAALALRNAEYLAGNFS